MVHVAESKKKIVKEFSDLINSYPVIGVVDMENLPTAQLQKMRRQLRDNVLIKMTKRRLINLILDNTKEKKKGIEEMKNYLTGIIVSAGPTPFSPGPVISELASAGIKTAIENGKIVVKSDAVVVKKGEKVSSAIAGILTRLGVEPMEVGLNLTAVYDNGTIFKRDVLDVDEEEFMSKIKTAYNSALGLALELSFLTKETTEIMITKAFREAKAIALSQNIVADGIKEEIMAKANREMLALKSKLNIPDAPKEEVKEEVKKEEQKAEVKAEKPEEKAKSDDTKEKPKEEKKEVKDEVIGKVEEVKEVEETLKEEKVPSAAEPAEKTEKKEEIKKEEFKTKENQDQKN